MQVLFVLKEDIGRFGNVKVSHLFLRDLRVKKLTAAALFR
jgi:hypothetical protein